MIWKDYLKLFEIVSYLKLARESKAPPRRNLVNDLPRLIALPFKRRVDKIEFAISAVGVNWGLTFIRTQIEPGATEEEELR